MPTHLFASNEAASLILLLDVDGDALIASRIVVMLCYTE